ncbi:porin [Curvibacter gracilis]|uniref:porin n=1 Tax=Curvibacter gracilis TaxID=230310 RepID=UPI000484A254|nr:porin [Curvibacter gracilis]
MKRFAALGSLGGWALCAVAQAQTDGPGLALGGQIKVGVQHLHYSGVHTDAISAPVNGRNTIMSDNASWFYVRGEEALDGQTRVFFHLEHGLLVNTGEMGSALSPPRTQAVGFKNPQWGRVLVGRWSTYHSADAGLSHNAIYDAGPYASGTLNLLGSIGRSLSYFAGGILSNLLRYDSPRWAHTGFSATYGFDEQSPQQAGKHTLNFNPTYNDGRLVLYWNTLYRARQSGEGERRDLTHDQHANRFGVAYAFDNGIKLAWLWDRNRVAGPAIPEHSLRRDAWALPFIYREGPHLWHLTYGEARPVVADGRPRAASGARMFSVGYEYALSKRSALALSYSTVSNQAHAAYDFWYPTNNLPLPPGAEGFRTQSIYAGIKHTF